MRQKSTVYSPSFHNQFQKSEQLIQQDKQKQNELGKKEDKEGQSEFRIKEATKKQTV